MDFDPHNPIVQLCLKAMGFEENNQAKEAGKTFLEAWNKANTDLEKFLAAFYVARHQATASDKLQWTETALRHALKINNDAVKDAFPSLYTALAKCQEELGQADKAAIDYNLAHSFNSTPTDKGPFYHGTRAHLQVGDLLNAGGNSNYKDGLLMNHIYFTALVNGAGLASALAKGEGPERVYIVEPTGAFENDPNVTNKKFPGNPTRSYRSAEPLKIVGEVTDWVKQSPGQIKRWREKLANNKGDIIN